jgi:hypothetical protein
MSAYPMMELDLCLTFDWRRFRLSCCCSDVYQQMRIQC